jgi:cephalosporin hydroxylase
MTSIFDFDNSFTDKNTVHSYFNTYQSLFQHKFNDSNNILEVGVYHGGSIKLWNDLFPNSSVFGIDIQDNIDNNLKSQLNNNSNIHLFINHDAYNSDFVSDNLSHIKFDILIDDGPHTLDSMKSFISLYSPLMNEGGILVIEDVPDLNWIEILKNEVSEELKEGIEIYNLRENKKRYDDILFVIKKLKRDK